MPVWHPGGAISSHTLACMAGCRLPVPYVALVQTMRVAYDQDAVRIRVTHHIGAREALAGQRTGIDTGIACKSQYPCMP